MPTQIAENDNMAANNSNTTNEIKVKTIHNGEVMIHYLDQSIEYEDLCKEIRGICRFAPDSVSNLFHVLFFFYFSPILFLFFFFFLGECPRHATSLQMFSFFLCCVSLSFEQNNFLPTYHFMLYTLL